MQVAVPARSRPTRAAAPPRRRALDERALVAGLAIAAVVVRLPLLDVPLGIDESGYAYVAAQWGDASGSLYGAQWVDRPPLLIATYAIALALGGELGVRIAGCVAAAVIVATCSLAANRLAGRTGLLWAGCVALALVSTPALQAHQFNAELPATAFVGTSIWLFVRALQLDDARTAVAAGVAAGCAVACKQSFVDGLVFIGVTSMVVAVVRRRRSGAAASVGRLAAGALAGAVLVASVVAAWAELWGPGVGELVQALYGFRIEAREQIAAFPTAPEERRAQLLLVALASGVALLFAATLAASIAELRRMVVQRGEPASTIVVGSAAGLAAITMLAALATWQGGNWWLHYLIQLVPALSVGAGLAVAASASSVRAGRVVRAGALYVMLAAVVVWTVTVTMHRTQGLQRPAHATGSWLADAADPGDTVFVAWGTPSIVWRSGLATPYEHLWSLPTRVRDPELADLRATIAGDEPPTWFVLWGEYWYWDVDRSRRLRELVRERYEEVSSICGRPVLRLRTADDARALPPPPPSDTCTGGTEPRTPARIVADLW